MKFPVLQKFKIALHRRTIFGCPKTSAIILAGGIGVRMGENTPKQYLTLRDKPVIAHTLIAFQKCSSIRQIVLVAREEDIHYCEAICHQYDIRKCKKVVVGGATRNESAKCGLKAVDADAEYVAIHDASRCLITPKQIADVCNAAYAYKAATAAAPVVDSIKVVNEYGFIEHNVDRATAWCAQTPQIFHHVLYRGAMEKADKEGIVVTDDNMLMESLGQRVLVVDCGAENFKITVPSDLQRAEAVLDAREKNK